MAIYRNDLDTGPDLVTYLMASGYNLFGRNLTNTTVRVRLGRDNYRDSYVDIEAWGRMHRIHIFHGCCRVGTPEELSFEPAYNKCMRWLLQGLV